MKRRNPRERKPSMKLPPLRYSPFHTRKETQWDLNFLQQRMDGNVQGFPKEVAEFFLEENNGNLGDGIRDPAGRQRDWDICAKGDGPNTGEEHLPRDWKHGDEESHCESACHRVAAGVPKAPLEHRRNRFLEPDLVVAFPDFSESGRPF
jgi:hypothetical protein